VRANLISLVTIIQAGLKNLDLLPGDFGPHQPPNQLFCLAAKHAATNQFNPATALTVHDKPSKKNGQTLSPGLPI
jgi:hypothetical protein